MSRKLILLITILAIASSFVAKKRKSQPKPKPKTASASTSETDYKYFLEYKPKQNIIYANATVLKDLKAKFEYVVVLFSSPSCGQCPHLLIEYRKLARDMYRQQILIPFVFFECDPFDSYCHAKERVVKYPSLRIYHKNAFTQFKGSKNTSDYTNWIYDRMVGSFHKLAKPDNTVQDLIKEGEVVILFFGNESYPLFSEFKLLTIMYEFGHFFIAKENEVKEKALSNCKAKVDEKVTSVIAVINPDNKACYFYNESFNYKKIMNFILDHDKIPVAPFDHNAIFLQERYRIPIIVFFSDYGEDHPFFKDYIKIAQKYKRKMSFTFVDRNMIADDLHKSNMDMLGIDRALFPCIRIFLKKPNGDHLKWKYSGPLNGKSVESFVKKVLHNKLKPYKKSETLNELAKINERSRIEKISRLNFSKKIEEESAPVILVIEGSEETCASCADLEEKMLQVKEKILERTGEFPYKMFRLNIQLNEIDNWIFDTTPEIILIKQNKDIRHFNEEFDENKIIAFIEDNIKEDSRNLLDNSNL